MLYLHVYSQSFDRNVYWTSFESEVFNMYPRRLHYLNTRHYVWLLLYYTWNKLVKCANVANEENVLWIHLDLNNKRTCRRYRFYHFMLVLFVLVLFAFDWSIAFRLPPRWRQMVIKLHRTYIVHWTLTREQKHKLSDFSAESSQCSCTYVLEL